MIVAPILCVTGPSGSGKTHLLERLIRRLTAEGLRVGAIKHCRHVDKDPSGKDSDRLGRAGARPAIAAAADGLVVQGQTREPLLVDLAAIFCDGCDLVLAEGYRRSVHDKIYISSRNDPNPPRDITSLRLLVGNEKAPGNIGRDDTDAIAEWVSAWFKRRLALREALAGAVLTGGASRRMGLDKSRLKIAGHSVLGRMCELLADRLGRVMVVGREPPWEQIPACVQWHADAFGSLGPLGGIATALRQAGGGDRPRGLCLAACDMPAAGGDLLDYLLAQRNPRAAATVLFDARSQRLQPLFGIYESQARQSIEEALDSGRLRVADWLTAAGAHRVPVPGELAGQLANVNTPAELEAIRSRME